MSVRRLPVVVALLVTGLGLLACEGVLPVEEEAAPVEEPVSTKDRLSGLTPTELVDPVNDAVMQYVVGSVPSVTDDQIRSIYDLYTKFRSDQARLAARQARMRAALGRGGDDGTAPPRRGMAARLEALETDFLAAGRLLLSPEQLPAWDQCAAAVDLSPPENTPIRDGGPEVGSAAPDFVLTSLDGRSVSLASLAGKPVVVEFGSYTCPIFRGNAPAISDLAKKYKDKAHFVLVYGHEAHTEDGWQVAANQREGILYDQPTAMPDRVAIAQVGVTKLGVASTVVIDGMDNAVTDGWEGHPNVGYLIDAQGKVASKMGIIDPVEIETFLSSLP